MTRERLQALAEIERKIVEETIKDSDIDEIIVMIMGKEEAERCRIVSTEETIIHGTLLRAADEEGINHWEFVHMLFNNRFECCDDGYNVYREYVIHSIENFSSTLEEQSDIFGMIRITMLEEVRGCKY